MRPGLSVSYCVQCLKSTRAQLGVTIHLPKDDLVNDILGEGLAPETVEVTSEIGLMSIVFQAVREIPFAFFCPLHSEPSKCSEHRDWGRGSFWRASSDYFSPATTYKFP
jgi:hypothetical protein